ncbi:MAG: hypothetical protein GY928_34435 [Colwellia sp.]|nr:hypothetical protein [Colwellia sp.]
MEKKYKNTLDYLIGDQKEEWLHPAITSHLRYHHKELNHQQSKTLVKEWMNEHTNHK